MSVAKDSAFVPRRIVDSFPPPVWKASGDATLATNRVAERREMFNEKLGDALNYHDMRRMAKQRLPRWLFEFVDRGTEDEVAMRNNRAAFERIKLKTQVLVDVSRRSQEIVLFGKKH